MNSFDFLPLEKAVDVGTVNELALVLGVNRRHVMHWRSVGLTEDEARTCALNAGAEPGDIWPELSGGEQRADISDEPESGEAPPASVGDNEIVWCDPPAAVRPLFAKGSWAARLAPLIDRPGEWARVGVRRSTKSAYVTASWLNRKAVLPPGRWEFTSRRLADGTGGIWARFVGLEGSD